MAWSGPNLGIESAPFVRLRLPNNAFAGHAPRGDRSKTFGALLRASIALWPPIDVHAALRDPIAEAADRSDRQLCIDEVMTAGDRCGSAAGGRLACCDVNTHPEAGIRAFELNPRMAAGPTAACGPASPLR